MTCGMCGREMVPMGTFTMSKSVVAYFCPQCDRSKKNRDG